MNTNFFKNILQIFSLKIISFKDINKSNKYLICIKYSIYYVYNMHCCLDHYNTIIYFKDNWITCIDIVLSLVKIEWVIAKVIHNAEFRKLFKLIKANDIQDYVYILVIKMWNYWYSIIVNIHLVQTIWFSFSDSSLYVYS
jgi:hypothetical protein